MKKKVSIKFLVDIEAKSDEGIQDAIDSIARNLRTLKSVGTLFKYNHSKDATITYEFLSNLNENDNRTS